jgi:hypothetical protein
MVLQFAPPKLAISSGGRNIRLAGTRYALPGTGETFYFMAGRKAKPNARFSRRQD